MMLAHLRRWRSEHAADRSRAPARERWVVVDTETSGLDPSRDELLAVGAVAVDGDGIRVADSFEAVVRNKGAGDEANVLVHGIGHAAQRAGMPDVTALAAFVDYVGEAPCVAFHAPFDRAVLTRALRACGLGPLRSRWMDLAAVAPALDPQRARGGAASLDDWIAAYGIVAVVRHNAAGDALATAELLLCLRERARAQGLHGFADLERLSHARRWLGPSA
jgi:DNA polymerase III subunit epsilon